MATERPNKLPDIVPAAQSRARKTIANWRSALNAAESVESLNAAIAASIALYALS